MEGSRVSNITSPPQTSPPPAPPPATVLEAAAAAAATARIPAGLGLPPSSSSISSQTGKSLFKFAAGLGPCACEPGAPGRACSPASPPPVFKQDPQTLLSPRTLLGNQQPLLGTDFEQILLEWVKTRGKQVALPITAFQDPIVLHRKWRFLQVRAWASSAHCSVTGWGQHPP